MREIFTVETYDLYHVLSFYYKWKEDKPYVDPEWTENKP